VLLSPKAHTHQFKRHFPGDPRSGWCKILMWPDALWDAIHKITKWTSSWRKGSCCFYVSFSMSVYPIIRQVTIADSRCKILKGWHFWSPAVAVCFLVYWCWLCCHWGDCFSMSLLSSNWVRLSWNATGFSPKLSKDTLFEIAEEGFVYRNQICWEKGVVTYTPALESQCKGKNALHEEPGSGWKKDEARPLVGVSAVYFVQCFKMLVGWEAGHLICKKTRCHIAKVVFRNASVSLDCICAIEIWYYYYC